MIIEKPSQLKLTRPAIIIDIPLEPPPKLPLAQKSGFCYAIVGRAGSGKTSTLLSMVKSADAYKKRFHKIISVIPESSLNSLKVNPL